jgi:preprotein translocase subunit SecD
MLSPEFWEDEPEVNIKFTDAAKDKLADFTSKNIGRRVVMILDGVVVQAPVLRDPLLTGEAIINGIPRDQMDQFVRR